MDCSLEMVFVRSSSFAVTGLYESLHNGLFLKDFQFSLWPGKKYAPAMPVYMKVSVNGG